MNNIKQSGYKSGLSSSFSSEAIAQFEEACKLEELQDWSAAKSKFKGACLMGHRDAAYRVGLLCLQGSDKDRLEAVFWFRKSANNNHPDALYQLGLIYEQGLGVAEDMEQAVRMWHSAAQGGSDDAQTKLASLPSNLARITWQKLEPRKTSSA
jgi:TPR repeat protein